MLTYQESKYIISEIARRPFYKLQMIKLEQRLAVLQEKKRQLSDPNCPQGHESIGQRGNEVTDFSKQLVGIVTRQEELKRERDFFTMLLVRATDYYEILMEGEQPMYVRDYFQTDDKRTLQDKYCISNAYDRMVRIVRQEIHKL